MRNSEEKGAKKMNTAGIRQAASTKIMPKPPPDNQQIRVEYRAVPAATKTQIDEISPSRLRIILIQMWKYF